MTRDGAGNINGGTVDFNVDVNFPPGPITFSGLHIHNERFGLNGGVMLNSNIAGGANAVTIDSGVGNVSRQTVYTASSTPAQLESLNGLFVDPKAYYINIHDLVNPGGIVRAQLAYETYRFRPVLSPDNEIPTNTSGASGTGWLTVTVFRNASNVITGGTVTFDVNYNLGGTATITGLHIHRGTALQNGSIVIDSGITGSEPVATTGSGNITRTAEILSTNTTGIDALNDLVKNPNGFYVNLHTTSYPGGIIGLSCFRSRTT